MKEHISEQENVIDIEIIREKIQLLRGSRVMLDIDLAELYGVQTKALNQAVQRNIKRFPADFMFQLSLDEESNLKSQFVTSSYGGKRKLGWAFTEQGIAMLSSVLRSDRAIEVNIGIMRVFTVLRRSIEEYKDVREKIVDMEKKYGTKFTQIFKILKYLTTEKVKPKNKIGFVYKEREEDSP